MNGGNSDEDLDRVEVLISALEHFSYCPRQCGLIHLEQTFDENIYTIRGQLAHERVDAGEVELTAGIRIERAIPLWSDRLGLRGKADVVEFRPDGPYPIEYKVGPPRGKHADVQLCAQALCLEEMLGVSVPRGAIFHVATRRRREVEFSESLRARTVSLVEATRQMLATQVLPPPVNDERCGHCSLAESCMPDVVSDRLRLKQEDEHVFELEGEESMTP
jgi:CRISPR-associated exonuclease Cas4